MLSIKKNIKLADYTTFKIGGNAKYFFIAKNEKDVLDILKWVEEKKEKIFILGGGSNLLFRDEGFNGVVIKMEMCVDIKIKKESKKKVLLNIDAGCKFLKLIYFSREFSFSGVEWASGIPRLTAGGAIRGNAGAFCSSMSDIVKNVRFIDYKDQNKKIIKLSNKECEFKYRSSIFKKNGSSIILSAELELNRGDKYEIIEKIKRYAKFRKEKQPIVFRNAGSIFKNVCCADFTSRLFFMKMASGKTPPLPPSSGELEMMEFKKIGVVPAGWIIEKIGLKGKKIGDAMISEKHANFIVNLGNATAKDVINLMELAEMEVKKKFGVKLEREIEVV